MTRRFLWISMAAVLAMTALAQPWRGAAEARPAPRSAGCRADDVVKLEAELAASRAALALAQVEVAQAQAYSQRLLEDSRARARKLAEQLGAPMIDTLKN